MLVAKNEEYQLNKRTDMINVALSGEDRHDYSSSNYVSGDEGNDGGPVMVVVEDDGDDDVIAVESGSDG